MSDEIDLKLQVWRQAGPSSQGKFEDYTRYAKGISTHASFLEFLDVVNERMVAEDEAPIVFDHDCREGICGACSLVINGKAHGPLAATTTCQLHMRSFRDGQTVTIEPFRARAFPVVRDLTVDRGAFDRIQQAGGFVSVNTGGAPDANAVPIGKDEAERAFDAAACIGCGACVAACPNASAMLFVAAKIGHLAHLPQGQPERDRRALSMVARMDAEGFGNCRNEYECEAVCPKSIPASFIAEMNRDWRRASARRPSAQA
jgi:succinate dehydrogenase / fumarate reductase iron-sulfur subunit